MRLYSLMSLATAATVLCASNHAFASVSDGADEPASGGGSEPTTTIETDAAVNVAGGEPTEAELDQADAEQTEALDGDDSDNDGDDDDGDDGDGDDD